MDSDQTLLQEQSDQGPHEIKIICVEYDMFQTNGREMKFKALSLSQSNNEIISIFHGCMVWIEKPVTRVTDRHHEACLVMQNSDPE